MARTVKYSVIPRINPRDRETEPKFYAQVQTSGDVSMREMCERIEQSCTVTKADVYAVLVAMENVIIDALKGGEIVRLGDLGTLRVSLSSKGALTEKEYNTSLITRKRIIFRPGVVLGEALANLTFTKQKEKSDEEENTEEGSGEETTGGENA
jgi:predicted histone-like DNA-binding protein